MEASDVSGQYLIDINRIRFNEAEAWKPRMTHIRCQDDCSSARFNEAEAWKPRMSDIKRLANLLWMSFNEAEAWKPRMIDGMLRTLG